MNFEQFCKELDGISFPKKAWAMRVGTGAWDCIREEHKMTHGGVTIYSQPYFAGRKILHDETLPEWGYAWSILKVAS